MRTAYLEGTQESETLPQGRVVRIHSQPNGVRAEVDAPEGGLVVFSSTWYPEWRAFANGARVAAERVNGLVTGARGDRYPRIVARSTSVSAVSHSTRSLPRFETEAARLLPPRT